jgi:hypothetical protein
VSGAFCGPSPSTTTHALLPSSKVNTSKILPYSLDPQTSTYFHVQHQVQHFIAACYILFLLEEQRYRFEAAISPTTGQESIDGSGQARVAKRTPELGESHLSVALCG